jgi:DNA-binding transcriptional MerR regulator
MTVRAPTQYRMKDLCELTGLERQAIHFYIQQGLLPAGKKTGRNMAWYGPEHVERIQLIRRLQHERFLPLKAIRAMLHQQEDAFSPAQRRLLLDVREHLAPALGGPAPGHVEPPVEALPLLERAKLERVDLDELASVGLLHVREDEAGRPLIAAGDVWLIELFGELRAAGCTRARGFTGADLSIYLRAIDGMFEAETHLLAERMQGEPPAVTAQMVARALPIINSLLGRYHLSLARNFFTVMPDTLAEDPR